MPFLKVDNACVSFPLHLDDHGRSFRVSLLKMLGLHRKSPARNYKRALIDIKFTARKGDRIGLIGRNGSGKTTLLRALNGIYEPESGRIIRSGQQVSLINITLGMDMNASGINNIFLRGLRMQMSREQMMLKLGDIVDLLN